MATFHRQGLDKRIRVEHGSNEKAELSTSWTQEGESKHSQSPSTLRLLLLGKRGAGKSATGNTILGKVVFESKFSEEIVTKTFQTESMDLRGRLITVIDTPDLFSSLAPAEVRQVGLQACSQLSPLSFQALILVIPIGHYRVEDEEICEGIRMRFGEEAFRHMVVVFTREDELGEDSLQDYIENNQSLKELVQNVENRYCAFNNKVDLGHRDSQLSKLLQLIEHLMEKSPEPYFMNIKMEGSRSQENTLATKAVTEVQTSHGDLTPKMSDLCRGSGHLPAQDCGNEVTYQEGDNPCGKRQLQATGTEQNPEIPELRILLIGMRGVGKSAAGNKILGKQSFKTMFSQQSVTQNFQSDSRIWKGKKVSVIDSPDILSWKASDPELKQHASLGPHAFLLVTPLGSWVKSHNEMFNIIKSHFGTKSTKYMIILLTREEDFGYQDADILIQRDEVVWDLIQKCGKRYSTFNSQTNMEEEQSQVDKLLDQVVTMVQCNDMKPCFFREKEPLTIVLVGKSGTGKSATGNSILRRCAFFSQLRARPVTQRCQSERMNVDGQDIVVVDTPSPIKISGVQNPSCVRKEVIHCAEGKIIFVLVVQLGRFTQEDKKVVEQLEAIWGDDFIRYTIVLFTRKEDLGNGNLEKYIKHTDNKALKNIVQKCSWRAYGFNNKDTGPDLEKDVKILLKTANDLRMSLDGYEHI